MLFHVTDEVLLISQSANVFVFAWYEEVHPVIQGSKAPPHPTPFSVSQYHSIQKVWTPLLKATLPPATLFLYFFQIPCFWQDFSDNIILMKYQINTRACTPAPTSIKSIFGVTNLTCLRHIWKIHPLSSEAISFSMAIHCSCLEHSAVFTVDLFWSNLHLMFLLISFTWNSWVWCFCHPSWELKHFFWKVLNFFV